MRTLESARSGSPARRGQVLILLLGYLFLGGSAAAGCIYLTGLGAKQVESALDDAVKDDARRKAAQAVVSDWSEGAKAFLERTETRRTKLLELLQGRDGSRAEIDAVFAEQDADVDRTSAKVLDHRFALRAQLDAKEWSAVFPGRH